MFRETEKDLCKSVRFVFDKDMCDLRIKRCYRVYEVDDKDIGGENDEVHQQAYAHKVAETITARAVDEHVCG